MAVPVLVDSNVLIDILTEDQRWFDWSATALAAAADRSLVAINPIIDAEVSIGFERIEEVRAALPTTPSSVSIFHPRLRSWP